jgi:hypothetical protein
MSSINNLSISQLRQAANLKERIVAFEKELSQLLGLPVKTAAAKVQKKKGGMSTAAKAKLSAAAKARWAKVKRSKTPAKTAVTTAPKKKDGMSAAAKANLSAAAKDRWAKAKAAGKKSL